MGRMILMAGILCMVAATCVFAAYLIMGKAAGMKLKKQLMDEY